MTADNEHQITMREESLIKKYGELLTLADVKVLLCYPSVDAVRKAHSRGTLPVKLVKFETRQGLFATTRSIARCIDALDMQNK